MTPKEQIQALLDQLPENASFEEIQNHLNSYGGRRSRSASRASWERCTTPVYRDQANDGARAFAVWQEIVSI